MSLLELDWTVILDVFVAANKPTMPERCPSTTSGVGVIQLVLSAALSTPMLLVYSSMTRP